MSSNRVRVSEFLAASVSSHYFSSHDFSLRGPTGATMMDRYILRGITGMRKEEITKKGVHLQSFISLHRDYYHTEPKGKATRLINHTYCAHILSMCFGVSFSLYNNVLFALKLKIIS